MVETPSFQTLLLLLRAALHRRCDMPEREVNWSEVYLLAQRHGVVALAWDGLKRMESEGRICINTSIDRGLRLRWAMSVEQIEKRSRSQHRVLLSLDAMLPNPGELFVFKGHALASRYPIPEHRECGDIDFFVPELYRETFEQNLLSHGATISGRNVKHVGYLLSHVALECHLCFVWDYRKGKMSRMNEELMALLPQSEPYAATQHIKQPSQAFNTLFIVAHNATHFRTEGMNLRQLLDWALVLQELSWEEVKARLQPYGYLPYVTMMNRVAREWLHFPFADEMCNADLSLYRRMEEDVASFGRTDHAHSRKFWRKITCRLGECWQRRWAFHLVGDSLSRFLIRQLVAYLYHPKTFFS